MDYVDKEEYQFKDGINTSYFFDMVDSHINVPALIDKDKLFVEVYESFGDFAGGAVDYLEKNVKFNNVSDSDIKMISNALMSVGDDYSKLFNLPVDKKELGNYLNNLADNVMEKTIQNKSVLEDMYSLDMEFDDVVEVKKTNKLKL